MMARGKQIHGEDIEIKQLVPLNTREINLAKNRGYQKILSTIKMVGLIEPLDVYKENGHYVILNGFLRFKALQELNVDPVPCLVHPDKEAYTYNKMINNLSPIQESRMLRKALKTIDHSTMAQVFGVKSLQYRLGTGILNHLHPKVTDAVDKALITRGCASELTYVTKERQNQILQEMNKTEDYSIAFARALVIKTPSSMRNSEKKKKNPWAGDSEKKRELVNKLETITKRYDFYSNLYRQYSADLLKLYVYARKLITNEKVRLYLEINFPEIHMRFENIIFEAKGVTV
jgi:ParB family transcriptional regulator, chromosome partitioning protein